MKFEHVKRLLIGLVVLLVLLTVWNDPAGAADATTGFVGDVGHFFSTFIGKLIAFFRELFG